MPERVSREERVISMTIEKARKVKELLRESMEGNRLPDEKDDRMEQVKVKRPKAEKDKTKIENQSGTHSGYGLAGETTQFKKSIPKATSWGEAARNAEFKAKMGGTSTIPKEVFEMFAKNAKEYEQQGRAFNNQQVEALMKYTLSMHNLGIKKSR